MRIYSRRCWLDGRLQEATLQVENGRIANIQQGKPARIEAVIDCGDHVLMPGVIDAHVHINEPGRTEWEGFDTATQAAAAGGTTTLVEMPLNASPVTTTAAALQEKLAAAKGKTHVHCGFYGGLIPDNLYNLPALLQSGIWGMKAFLVHSGIDEFPNVSMRDLEESMPLIAAAGMSLLVHCEWEGDADTALLDAHPTSYQAYLAGRPKAWENEAIRRMIDLCRRFQCPVHIVHLSSAEALDMIREAKTEGLPLTVETCAQYLFFDAENIPDGNTLFKCAPPIREKANNDLLRQAVAEGLIDFIATDHSPAPPAVKALDTGNLQKAWGGIAGIQYLLPAAWTALKNRISLESFIPLLTEHPAQFLKMAPAKGVFQPGSDADFVVWSPETTYEVQKEQILFRHPISPYVGQQFQGAVLETYVDGQLVFKNNKIITKNAGRCLLRQ